MERMKERWGLNSDTTHSRPAMLVTVYGNVFVLRSSAQCQSLFRASCIFLSQNSTTLVSLPKPAWVCAEASAPNGRKRRRLANRCNFAEDAFTRRGERLGGGRGV